MAIPMVDDDQYAEIAKIQGPPSQSPEERFAPCLVEYERITGFHETNWIALIHHRLSMYGPPCSNCGKPLRSLSAKMCGACMVPVLRLVPEGD